MNSLTPFEIKASNILFFAMILANLSFLTGICTFVSIVCLGGILLSTIKRKKWLLALASCLILVWILT